MNSSSAAPAWFTADIYAMSEDEGGRRRPFGTGYAPQFFFRTAFASDGGVADARRRHVTVMARPVDRRGASETE